MGGRSKSATKARAPCSRASTTRRKTKRDILSVATKEFAKHGFNGARIDAIAARTSTTKRMIYYYFGGKEPLYIAVLEQQYASIRAYEARLATGSAGTRTGDSPTHRIHVRLRPCAPGFRAPGRDREHPPCAPPGQVDQDPEASTPPSSTPSKSILQRGRRERIFRAGVRAIDVHMLMSALCFFHVSNLHTFGAIFRSDFLSPKVRSRHKKMVADFIVHHLKSG